jgi:hypothetical protein
MSDDIKLAGTPLSAHQVYTSHDTTRFKIRLSLEMYEIATKEMNGLEVATSGIQSKSNINASQRIYRAIHTAKTGQYV